MEQSGYWFTDAECAECNAGRLAFAVRRDGRTCFLLCVDCGANYAEPPRPGDENPAFDPAGVEISTVDSWARRRAHVSSC